MKTQHSFSDFREFLEFLEEETDGLSKIFDLYPPLADKESKKRLEDHLRSEVKRKWLYVRGSSSDANTLGEEAAILHMLAKCCIALAERKSRSGMKTFRSDYVHDFFSLEWEELCGYLKYQEKVVKKSVFAGSCGLI